MFNSLTSGVKPCRLFSRNSFPAATRVWSKIYCSDESVSSQTFNYFLYMFSGRSFFLVNYLKILTVTDMVEIFKISVSKRLGHGTHSQNKNAPNARNNTFSRIKCGKVWLQKFKFKYSIAKFLLVWLNQFNRAASTTETKSNSIFAVKFVERSNRSFSVYLTNQRYNYNSIELWNFNCVNISTRSEAIKILLQQILKRHKIVFKNNSLFPVQCTLALNSPIRRQKCVLAISEALKNILSYLYKNTHVYIIDKKETESHFRYYEMI